MDNNNNYNYDPNFSPMGSGKSSLGMDENIAALLSYVLGWVTGLIFFFLEKQSRFVKFHALQSTITFAALWVITFVIGFIPVVNYLNWVINLGQFILWIVLMVKAYQKEMFKLPIVGDIVEQQLGKM